MGVETTVEDAFAVFAHAWCDMRARTRPYGLSHFGGLRLMADQPPGRHPRTGECHALPDYDALEAEAASRRVPYPRFWLCLWALPGQEDAIKERVKGRGRRLARIEGCFAHDLSDLPAPSRAIRTITDPDEAQSIQRARSRNAFSMERFAGSDPHYRLYVAEEAGQVVGTVQSVRTPGGQWVLALGVDAAFRGRGYGFSLMAAMMRDDQARGKARSVLLASQAGARLYPHLGYRRLASLLIFDPLGAGTLTVRAGVA